MLSLEPSDNSLRFREIASSADHAIRPSTFVAVIENLIKNPNITSSHLFRADILYDSATDASYDPVATTVEDMCKLARHMQSKFQPRVLDFASLNRRRTIVREFVPRNPKRDARLPQTCHFYDAARPTGAALDDNLHGDSLVVYLPHAEAPHEVPWYHPPVKAVAFLLEWQPANDAQEDGSEMVGAFARLSISIAPFDKGADGGDASTRLERTVNNLLTTIIRHCNGRQAGYTKRVQLDTLVPQARMQDTYTRLKGTYATRLTEGWLENTDPSKHVFEDLLIAAFLIELWRDLYRIVPRVEGTAANSFRGFVDIGCGNGLLVHILRSEGYQGWGFDIRERKSWSAFPPEIATDLRAMTLVPSIFGERPASLNVHNGIFPADTFIISNHADELTAWTPILASLSGGCPFLAIPCCSHDLGGSRTRFKPKEGWNLDKSGNKRSDAKPPSAYATLCDYIQHVTEAMGYEAHKEVLRIPSTRNEAVFGTMRRDRAASDDTVAAAIALVEGEMKASIKVVADAWWDRAEKIRVSKGTGH